MSRLGRQWADLSRQHPTEREYLVRTPDRWPGCLQVCATYPSTLAFNLLELSLLSFVGALRPPGLEIRELPP